MSRGAFWSNCKRKKCIYDVIACEIMVSVVLKGEEVFIAVHKKAKGLKGAAVLRFSY
jgi:hypothetical protein